jgi:hypothetical protein
MVEHKIGEYQMSFRLNRSTMGNIMFMTCQIYEKYHKYNTAQCLHGFYAGI